MAGFVADLGRASTPSLWWSLLYVLTVTVGLFAVLLRPLPPFVVVVARPSSTPADMMAIIGQADGRFVSDGIVPWISVAYSEVPDFHRKLVEAGAVLVVNHSLAVGCLQRGNE